MKARNFVGTHSVNAKAKGGPAQPGRLGIPGIKGKGPRTGRALLSVETPFGPSILLLFCFRLLDGSLGGRFRLEELFGGSQRLGAL